MRGRNGSRFANAYKEKQRKRAPRLFFQLYLFFVSRPLNFGEKEERVRTRSEGKEDRLSPRFCAGGGPRLEHSLSSYSPRRVNFSSYFIFFIWRGGRKEKVGTERGGGGDEATGGLIRMADTRSPRVVCCLDRPASCAWHAKSSCRVPRSDFFFFLFLVLLRSENLGDRFGCPLAAGEMRDPSGNTLEVFAGSV